MKQTLLLLSLFCSNIACAGLLFGKSASFRVPSSLAKDVAFWEKIFSVYEADKCVYHDSANLDIVYWVSTVPLNDRRMMRRQMKKQKKQIKRALQHLALGRKPTKWLHRKILSVVPKSKQNKRYYKSAQNRIRCQRGVATDFRQSLKRSQSYLPMIKRKLKNLGLPKDLAYLPHLESGFNVKAHSKVGARGLWQLMPGTARQYMKVNRRRDDRINPYRATHAAAKILYKNFEKTKSWPLAITAYNYGINGVSRAIRKYNTNDYLTIRRRHRTKIFGFAAKNFYPSFIAVRNLAMKHESRSKESLALRKSIAARKRENRASR